MSGTAVPSTAATPSSTSSTFRVRSNFALFQLACMPTASRNTSGSIGTGNTVLKYGSPTELLPSLNQSMATGCNVPMSTTTVATTSSRLLSSRKDSREISPKPTSARNSGARQAYSASAAPTHTARNTSRYAPRDGSEAKACTDSMMPERTRKVPSSDNANAVIASSSVQPLN